MAARKDSRIKEKHRKAIQTSMLIKRLENHVLKDTEMSPTQIRSAEILLNKSLPNLRSTELTGDDGGPVKVLPFEFVSDEQS
ncbi:MAG: hypothetical protein GOVbin7744_27 [Prokaryotic dsDNA virus sp.]|nr:MAG: hypothetical protein GOVbin7744_27 [Prokaryotic dsDNA virus sp.]|tara:strand:+ start:10156 stop:10401 length:246 start_codon:yes stop_codon:yes gene_type:complete